MKINVTFKDDVLAFWNNTANNKPQPDNLKYLLHEDVCKIANVLSQYDIDEINKDAVNKTDKKACYDIYLYKIESAFRNSRSFYEGYNTVKLKERTVLYNYSTIDSKYYGGIIGEFLYGASSAIVKPYLKNKIKEIENTTTTKHTSNVKLKWKGSKTQFYDILRQLKSLENIDGEKLITNSYEDLAFYLKMNVDVFSDTALSTITKEIGKNKRPPKNRRIDISITW